MALMSIADRLEFKSDLCLVEAEVRVGVNEDYIKKKDRHWIIWETYCTKATIDPFLLNVEDPLPYLDPISKSMVEDYAMADSPPAVNRSNLQQFQTTLPLWVRDLPVWGPMTHV